MKTYKRQWRELSNEHKEKISQSSINKPKSTEHKEHISQAMKEYWRSVPHRPEGEEEHTTMADYLGVRK